MLATLLKELLMFLLVCTCTLAITLSPIIARVLTDHLHPAADNTLPPTYGN